MKPEKKSIPVLKYIPGSITDRILFFYAILPLFSVVEMCRRFLGMITEQFAWKYWGKRRKSKILY